MFVLRFVMSTHVLDKQIDKTLRDEGVPDGISNLICKSVRVTRRYRLLCFCDTLLTLVNLRTQAR